jgi:DNA modification methylase
LVRSAAGQGAHAHEGSLTVVAIAPFTAPRPYYEADGIAIYHGDCREIIRGLNPGSVSLVVTSPPYNQMTPCQKKPSGMWATSMGAGFLRAWRERGYSDNMPEADYTAWQTSLFGEIRSVCSDDASLFYNHQLRWRDGACSHPVKWFTPDGWNFRQEIIWNRGGGMMFNARMFVRFDERILWFVRSEKWKWNQSAVGFGTIWNIAREQQQQGKEHPVAFPLELPARCIAAASDPGDIVLDPFMGSGTTLVAAKNLGRRAVGIDADEHWCEVAARRLGQGVLALGAP